MYLPTDLVKRVKLLAVERECSLSSLTEQALTEFVRRSRDSHDPIPTDLEEAP